MFSSHLILTLAQFALHLVCIFCWKALNCHSISNIRKTHTQAFAKSVQINADSTYCIILEDRIPAGANEIMQI